MREREIADRLEIGDLLARYAHVLDVGDWARLDLVFTADAVLDHTSAGGGRGTREEARRWLAETLSRWPVRHHLIGLPVVRFEGDEAEVTVPYTGTLVPAGGARGTGLVRTGGWHHHRMARTPYGWRSGELVEEQAWRVTGERGV
ncbi:nuclear transport factor 2 family protein [Streptosporangium algeriense]|uniref:Nuclear transport factor 2 family protein n=1 Tax=Streptosporangium algeriense TaxID=1682748 RepID=A0ABW3E1A0_9ACTN